MNSYVMKYDGSANTSHRKPTSYTCISTSVLSRSSAHQCKGVATRKLSTVYSVTCIQSMASCAVAGFLIAPRHLLQMCCEDAHHQRSGHRHIILFLEAIPRLNKENQKLASFFFFNLTAYVNNVHYHLKMFLDYYLGKST